MATCKILGFALSCALLATAALSCSVPHGGCRPTVCDSIDGISVGSVYFPDQDYSQAATWLQGDLPKMGYVLGTYNKIVNPTGYDRKGIKDTPGLNLERFDLETNVNDPTTNAPYASPSPGGETDLKSCCHRCRQTDGCYLYQFFPADTDPSYNGGVQCYLLSGGTQTWDFPERGTPFSGSASKQGPGGSRASIPVSFVGGRCNGTTNIVDDPHFTGAHGTRFDFNGEIGKSFCLTADEGVQINALLKGYKDTNTEGATAGNDGHALRTWMREVAFLWKDSATKQPHTLHLVARSGPQQDRGLNGFLESATLNGKVLPLPLKVGAPFEEGDLSFIFQGTVVKGKNKIQQDQYLVRIGEHLDVSLSMRVAHKKFQTPDEAQAHFNILINHLRTTERVHGVLGQTYRTSQEQAAKAIKYTEISRLLGAPVQADGESGKGFLEGDIKDYVTSAITAADCKFSPF